VAHAVQSPTPAPTPVISSRFHGLIVGIRGLAFTATALRLSMKNPSQELTDSFTQSYENTLKKYHSFIIRPVFGVPLPPRPTYSFRCPVILELED
jgi:hypothetical protein